MKVINAIDNGLTKIEEFFAEILMICMIVTVTLQIMNNSFIHSSALTWTEELSRVFLVWTLMIGACIVTKRGKHLVVTFIYDNLKGTFKTIVRVLVLLISIAVCFYVSWSGVYMVKAQIAGKSTFAMIGLPTPVASISIPICFAVMGIRFIIIGIQELYAAKHGVQEGEDK